MGWGVRECSFGVRGLLVFLGTVAVGFVGMWSRNPAALPGAAPRGGVGPSPFVPRARPGHLRSRESLKRGSAGPGAVKPLPSVPIVSPPHSCPGDARLPPGRGALLAKM